MQVGDLIKLRSTGELCIVVGVRPPAVKVYKNTEGRYKWLSGGMYEVINEKRN